MELRRSWERPWPAEQQGFLRVLMPLVLAWPLERPKLTAWAGLEGWSSGAAAFTRVFLFLLLANNSLFLVRYLAHRDGRLAELHVPLRLLLWGFLAVPLLGLLTFPGVLAWLQSPPRWATRQVERRPGLRGRFSPSWWRVVRRHWTLTLRAFERSRGWLVWLFGVNILVVFGAFEWIARAAVHSSALRYLALVVSWGLHGFAFFGLWNLAREWGAGKESWKRSIWWPLPLAGLLPMPWALLSLLPVILNALERRKSSLVATAFATDKSARRVAVWGHQVGTWGERLAQYRGLKAASALGLWEAAKIAWLWPEGLLLGKVWASWATSGGELATLAQVTLAIFGGAAMITLALAGLLALVEALGCRILSKAHWPALFATVAGLVCGWWVGAALGAADSRIAGERLFRSGASLSLIFLTWLTLLGLLAGSGFQARAAQGTLASLGGALAATFLGLAMLTRSSWGAVAASAWSGLAALSPLGSILLGYPLGPRVLKPYRVAHLRDPQLPRALRWKLRLLFLGAFVPFGGLVTPWSLQSESDFRPKPLSRSCV